MTAKEVVALLKKDGWELARVRGSHHQFKHSEKSGTITVPFHSGDLSLNVLKSIEAVAKIKLRK